MPSLLTGKKSGTAKSLKKLQDALEPSWKLAPTATTGPAPDRSGRPITEDDIFALKLAGDPNVSPDGTRIAAAIQHIDRESNEYRAALWLFATDGSTRVQLTSGKWSDGSPRWSPDGEWLAFTSKRDTDRPQIWLLPTRGGEARRVTDLANGAGSPSWSPDGTQLVFTSSVDPEGCDPENDVRVITSARYKFDGKGFLDGKTTHIFTVDAFEEGADPVRLTFGDFEHDAPAWSPTGREIAFLANRDPDWDKSAVADVWTIPAAGGEPRRLTDGKGSYGSLAWSPDGAKLAITGVERVRRGAQNPKLFVIGAGGGKLKAISANIDRAVGDRSMSGPNGPVYGPTAAWSADGKTIDVLLVDRGATRVVRFDVKSCAATVLTGSDRHVSAFAPIPGSKEFVIAVADPTTPAELRIVGTKGERRLTDFNDTWLAEVGIATPEEFWVESNNRAVQGWLLRPAGNSSTGSPVPVILNVHGGPHAQFSPAWFHELQMYAARGFALIYINSRGSLGYDESFAEEVTAAWGVADSPDFLAAIDHVVSLGGIDGERVGITGGSYGGFVTNWMIGTTDRFKAAVTDRSISNMISMYGTDDIALVSLDPDMGTPWDNLDLYWSQSPLKYVASITAPLLIVHSENDYRCPMEQAEQMFIALKKLGRTVEFVRYPNESHGLSRNGGPKHRVDRLRRTLGWFEKHL